MSAEEIKKQIESWKTQQKEMEANYNKLTGAISAFEFLLAKTQASSQQTGNVVESQVDENDSQ
jgi:hypothetical protein